MNLTSLAISNMKHNIKRYVMYFSAMCFSVFTTYSFLSLIDNKSIKENLHFSRSYTNTFIIFGIVILVFVLFFLISSNNSFIRARKKEISTYALFGMENSKIGKLLYLETAILGSLALIVGIALGIFFSKLISMILLNLIMSSYKSDIKFSIEITAILRTIIIFFAIFSIMGLSGFRVINKFKLVDLFKGDKISEGASKGSYLLLIISLILISGGYYLAFATKESMDMVNLMLPIITSVILGTYLFFGADLRKSYI